MQGKCSFKFTVQLQLNIVDYTVDSRAYVFYLIEYDCNFSKQPALARNEHLE